MSESHYSKVTGFKTVTLLQLRYATGVFLLNKIFTERLWTAENTQ